MIKKRRTKKDKIKAVSRLNKNGLVFNYKPQPVISERVRVAPAREPSRDYSYVIEDMRKTATIISFIVALNFILFLVLKFKLISVFGIDF